MQPDLRPVGRYGPVLGGLRGIGLAVPGAETARLTGFSYQSGQPIYLVTKCVCALRQEHPPFSFPRTSGWCSGIVATPGAGMRYYRSSRQWTEFQLAQAPVWADLISLSPERPYTAAGYLW